ncbi:MAG TPA: SMR family transporter [Chroococcales cyanobacterium]|jgi:small multidrug resistance pump/quaternary ammonium compound-resistance protein SugE
MYLLMVLAAAVSFTVGGIYMKLSQGLSHLTPSLLVYVFFCAGASLQTLAMRKSELGVTYIFILGLEAVLALLFGVFFFKETYSFLKLLGVSLIVAGIIFLRTSNS